MTVGTLFLVKSLAFWVGLFFSAHALWTLLANPSRAWRSAAAAVVLLAISSSLPGIAKGPDAFLHVPVAIAIFPTEMILLVPAAILALVRCFQMISSVTAREKAYSFRWVLVLGGLGFLLFLQVRQSPTQWQLRGGTVDLSITQVLLLIPLAICSVLAISATFQRTAISAVARNVAVILGLITGSIVFGLPLAWMLSTSFRDNGEINGGMGVRWIPVIQVRQSYLDPVKPTYAATVDGVSIEGVVLATKSNGDRVLDIRRPLDEIGQTATVPASAMKAIPQDVPVVRYQGPNGPLEALDLETLPNGQHRLHVLGMPEATPDLVLDAGKITEVRKPGMQWSNYPDALEFLPPETLHGLVYLRNTATILVLSVIGAVLSGAIVAYAFARLAFPGKKFLFNLLLSTMMLPSAVTLMPQFLVFRELGWIDTLKPLWAPAFFASAFNVFMLRQFYAGVPLELEEAAKVDGCSIPRTFWSISLPQIKPALATIAIWTAVGAWNNFTGPLIYISSPENMPISYAVQLFQGARSNEPALLMAFVTMSIIPVVLLFLFAQRYFVQSATASGLGGR